jgi:hypothetical protein
VVIKPHPRKPPDQILEEMSVDGKALIATEISSVPLIEWADLAIAFGSSIAVQVLLDNKIFLYPSFFDSNTLFATEMGACWECKTVDSMVDAVRSIKDRPSYKPYSDSSVKRFLTEYVYAGAPSTDAFENYASFIEEVLRVS